MHAIDTRPNYTVGVRFVLTGAASNTHGQRGHCGLACMRRGRGKGRPVTSTPLCNKRFSRTSYVVLLVPLVITSSAGCHAGKIGENQIAKIAISIPFDRRGRSRSRYVSR